jgi:two-component system NtrC family response regulator
MEAEARAMGHDVSSVNSLAYGLKRLRKKDVDLVILDVYLPDGNGLEALPDIRKAPSSPEVIMLSAVGDPESAERAIKQGAWSYFIKPPPMDKIKVVIQRAMDFRQEKSDHRTVNLKRYGIYGDSEAMRNCLDRLALAASCDSNVLITGETGTGKELFAQAIHKNSNRSRNRFVVVDCAAMPDNLVENLLFGHERGAFTSADTSSEGLITQADKGSLFLDEIGELPVSVQKSFLRVLEGRHYRPVGGTKELKSDFRLVAATNRDLDAMAENGAFRTDLLHRLRGIHIDLPPLRQCKSDINDMTCKFIGRICRKRVITRKGFTNDFLEALENYHWPGNVRELIHALEYAVTAAGEIQVLYPRHLPTHIRASLAREQFSEQEEADKPQRPDREHLPKLKEFREHALADLEKHYLQDLMTLAGGNIRRACEMSGLSRPRLYALLKKYEVSRS